VNESGGHGPTRAVIELVGKKLEGQLHPMDWEQLPTGGIRWQNRVQFARLKLVEQGLLAKDSPRGIWSITDKGKTSLSRPAKKAS
jgi:hypothetical protein